MNTSCDTDTLTIKTSPWGKVAAPQAVNLSDIISEEVARDLQQKEFKKAGISESEKPETPPDDDSFDMSAFIDENTENVISDMEIAKILQQKFDKEYDDVLKREEGKLNGTAKVRLSFENYRRAPQNDDFESDSEEEEIEDPRDRVNWDRFDNIERELHTMPACGYKVTPVGDVITKHDITLNGRVNACKLMSLPPEFHAGDGAEFDLKISNKVYNALRNHSKSEESRRRRMRDKREDYATAEFAIDEFTRIILFKLINKQLLKQVNGVISVGKEAVVLHAVTDPNYEQGPLPEEVVIKVFKTTLSEYKQRDRYIKDDHRFKDRFSKQNTRAMVHLWAEKEMRNLRRLERAKIPSPKAIILKNHVLIMSFIGENYKPAPKLKNAVLNDAEWIIAYEQTINYMKILYNDAKLIHADLSEYNLLWFDNTVYFIDVSQSVEPNHEHAFWFLHRDCENISKFFERKRVDNVLSPSDLFYETTGCRYEDKIALTELQQSFKLKPHMVDVPGMEGEYKFEPAWERSSVPPEVDIDRLKLDGVADLSLIENDSVASCSNEVEEQVSDSSGSFEDLVEVAKVA